MDWQQLIVIHVSDLHFGASHRFDPPLGDDGMPGPRVGIPTLDQSLLKDLASAELVTWHHSPQEGEPVRVVFALTGDFTEIGAEEEFDRAREFLSSICGRVVFGWTVRRQDIFIVPGNHDVRFLPNHTSERWSGFCRFYNDHLREIATRGE